MKEGFIHKFIVDTFHHIQEDMGFVTLWESATHHTYPVARGQLHFHLIVIEKHAIVACFGGFILMLESRSVARSGIFLITFVRFHITDDRHKPKISIVGAARTAEVGGAEAKDGFIGSVVARTAVPVVHAGVGTELHHTERRRGTREGVTMASRPDERVDIFGRVFHVISPGLRAACREAKQ